jgi:nucleoside 2-deoxyribosyltransferase
MPKKTPPRPKVYLAGPEVFLRNAVEVGAIKAEICSRHGLDGKYPLDAQLDFAGLALAERAYAIFRANEGLIRECDAVIANLTPFRGVGVDTGTAYEVGFMRGVGRPVFGYSNSHLSFFDRIAKWDSKSLKARAGADPTMGFEDSDKMGVEQFGLAENLMIESAVHDSGGTIVQAKTKRGVRYTDLAAFEECVKQAAAVLLKSSNRA